MGKPVKKRWFGNTANAGSQILVSADIGAGAENCWIIEQVGSRTFRVASVAGGATPTRTGKVKLQSAAIAGVGQARLTVTPSDGAGGALAVEYARSLNSHVVKTFSNKVYRWKIGVATAALTSTTQAQVAFA